mmetsp:Transcript_43922/g.110225  ORF Transcript_43922/g.110225 Transcript_43922/m.110225 type:complete len:205 (+) Transcript_43922:2714-3328(+)
MYRHLTARLDGLAQDGLQQRALAAADLAHHDHQLPGVHRKVGVLQGGAFRLLGPCEAGVGDLHRRHARLGARPALRLLRLLQLKKVLQALVRHLGVDEVHDLHGQHDDREAEQVEECERREGHRGGERLPERRKDPERRERDEDGARGEQDHVDGLQEGGGLDLLQLHHAQVVDLLLVRLLPCVQLDRLDAGDDLRDHLYAFVG